jgi:hypothetical protein
VINKTDESGDQPRNNTEAYGINFLSFGRTIKGIASVSLSVISTPSARLRVNSGRNLSSDPSLFARDDRLCLSLDVLGVLARGNRFPELEAHQAVSGGGIPDSAELHPGYELTGARSAPYENFTLVCHSEEPFGRRSG